MLYNWNVDMYTAEFALLLAPVFFFYSLILPRVPLVCRVLGLTPRLPIDVVGHDWLSDPMVARSLAFVVDRWCEAALLCNSKGQSRAETGGQKVERLQESRRKRSWGCALVLCLRPPAPVLLRAVQRANLTPALWESLVSAMLAHLAFLSQRVSPNLPCLPTWPPEMPVGQIQQGCIAPASC